MNRKLVAACLVMAAGASVANAQAIMYDGLNAGTNITFTGSNPRTYMSQAFSVTDPTATPTIGTVRVVLVAGAAVNFANTRIRVTLWDTYDPAATGAATVFSNSLGTFNFTTGPVTSAGAASFVFTLGLGAGVPLTGLTNHGISFNWQSDAAGTGAFIDNSLLTTALRTGATGSPPPALTLGSNLNPAGGYFRNASGLTNFNATAGDARSITNVGGLAFELIAVPTPGAAALLGMGGLMAARRRRTA